MVGTRRLELLTSTVSKAGEPQPRTTYRIAEGPPKTCKDTAPLWFDGWGLRVESHRGVFELLQTKTLQRRLSDTRPCTEHTERKSGASAFKGLRTQGQTGRTPVFPPNLGATKFKNKAIHHPPPALLC